MVNPINVVKVTAVSLTPSEFQLGGFLSYCFRFINLIHRIWFWFRRFDLYRNPDNFLKLAGGHTLNWFIGDRALIKIAAQALLIATRLMENVKEQAALVKEFKGFWRLLTNKYLISKRIKYENFEFNKFFSIKTKYHWKRRVEIITKKIILISVGILNLFKRLFVLSMKTMDVLTAFSYGSAQLKQESLNEFFINGNKCMEELIGNKERLLDSLKKNKATIGVLLKNSFSIFTIDQLIKAVEKGLNITEKIHKSTESTSQAVGVFGKDFIKRAGFGVLQAGGLTDLMPASWVPSHEPIWMKRKKKKIKKERFPNIKLVTKIFSLEEAIKTEIDCQFSNKKEHLGNKLLKTSMLSKLEKDYSPFVKVKV